MKEWDVVIYDTTLRDGTQGEQISFSAEDKLRIARRLDDMGFHYIEGGWPGSNPKDIRFFQLAREINFKNSRLAAFGSTVKPGERPEDHPGTSALIEAGTPAVTIVGKSWDLHLSEILKISPDENLTIIDTTVRYLKSKGKEVIFGAEHFFDGYKYAPAYAMKTILSACEAGADTIVLCDTNGGALTWEFVDMINEVKKSVPPDMLGVHIHNDCGIAVANSLAAVACGVRMVQGTINGYGERCGNADLVTIVGNLVLKMNKRCIPESSLVNLTKLSRFVSEVANIPPQSSRPYVGRSAFAHKGGYHVDAIRKNPVAYEHIDPELVGNSRRVITSDLSGKSSIAYKAKELGIDLDDDNGVSRKVVAEIKKMENDGYQFDAADGSLALLIKKTIGEFRETFTLESFHVIDEKARKDSSDSKAVIKISVGEDYEITAAEGVGPVNALDHALRKALRKFYPEIDKVHLVDFKVRILAERDGTAAKVRVLLESRDEEESWTTIGVSPNIIEASWHALVDSMHYKLSKVKRSKKSN